MGAVESVHYNSKSVSDQSGVLAFRSDHSGVLAFHTSSEWRRQFDSLKGTNQLLVVDFTATWCGPCKYMEPVLRELAGKYTDVVFCKIDIDELMDVAQEYGVQTVPMFMLIKQGKEVDKIVGADKGELERKIEKHRV